MKTGFGTFIIAVLVVGVFVGAAFAGGVLYGRNTAPTPKTTTSASAAGAGGGGAAAAAAAGGGGATGGGGAGGGGGGGGGGAAAAGTPGAGPRGAAAAAGQASGQTGNGVVGAIESVSGNTVTVRNAQGVAVPVNVTSDTRVLTSQQGAVADLKPGQIVTVVGAPDSSGNLAATGIQIQPLGPGAPGAQTQPGQRPGGATAGDSGQAQGGQGGRRPSPTPAPSR